MRIIAFLPLMFLSACASYSGVKETTFEYRCDEVVLAGRVLSITHSDVLYEEGCLITEDGECIPWRGRYDLEIQVKQHFKGDENRQIVHAWYIAHSQIRNDVDFVFFLKPSEEGYELIEAHLYDKSSEILFTEPCVG